MPQRLDERVNQLEQARQISAAPPVIVGGALIIPAGLIYDDIDPGFDSRITEQLAMKEVMETETALGNLPRDVSQQKYGYDIESLDPRTGRLRFIEVKGRQAGADTVTITRNEILAGINSAEQFILALVSIKDDLAQEPRYLRKPFGQEPEFGVTSVNYDLNELLIQSSAPK